MTVLYDIYILKKTSKWSWPGLCFSCSAVVQERFHKDHTNKLSLHFTLLTVFCTLQFICANALCVHRIHVVHNCFTITMDKRLSLKNKNTHWSWGSLEKLKEDTGFCMGPFKKNLYIILGFYKCKFKPLMSNLASAVVQGDVWTSVYVALL